MANYMPSINFFDDEGGSSNMAQKWDRWILRLENYLAAMDIDDDARKRSLLLHFVGPKTFDDFQTIADTGTDYKTAKEKLTTHFKPQVNTEYEIAKFRRMRQQAGENIDAYYVRLVQQVALCGFANKDSELKSHIIQTTKDAKLRKKGLSEKMTLLEVLSNGRSNELCKVQNEDIEKMLQQPTVNKVSKTHSKGAWQSQKNMHQRKQFQNGPNRNKQSQNNKCRLCGGKFPHPGGRQKCPAWGKECRNCSRLNHFAKMYRQPRQDVNALRVTSHVAHEASVSEVAEQAYFTDSSDDEYAFTISSSHENVLSKPPKFNVTVDGCEILVTADTAASCNIIDECTFVNNLESFVKLEKCDEKINPYGGGPALRPLGTFKAIVMCAENEKWCEDIFYVLPGKYGCLLSVTASQKLSLVKIADHVVNSTNVNVKTSSHDGSQLFEKYPQVCDGVGKMKNLSVKLHINENVVPVAQRHRRVPFHLRQKVEDELDRLEKLDIIEKVDGPTPWVSPIVVAPKAKNPDEVRICVDMRQANEAITRHRHPMPTIDDVLNKVNGSTVFSKLDLKCGYHQLLLDEESRYITTFSTHIGLRRYKRLSFGVSSASEIFQSVIEHVIDGVKGAMNLSDDIIIFGADQKSHDKALEEVFQRLAKHGLTVNRSKCELNKTEIEFFGVIFSGQGIGPDPKKIEALKGMSRPTNVQEIQSLLGMVNFCSRFIPNYSTVTAPLRELTRANTVFDWGKKQQVAYEKIVEHLSTKPILAYFDVKKDTEIFVDASPVGLGAILCQNIPQQGRVVVAYGSRALTPTEQRYAQIEREALACLWACEHFDIFISGGSVTIYTDHRPLLSMFGKPQAKLPTRLERWSLKLQAYQPVFRYKRGKDNPADYLSRHPLRDGDSYERTRSTEQYVNFVTEHAVPKAMTLAEVKEETDKDKTLQAVKTLVKSNKWYLAEQLTGVDHKTLSSYEKLSRELTVTSGGMLLRGNRICLPATLQKKALNIAHEGHQGQSKTTALLREKVWFPRMDKAVQDLLHGCVACQANHDAKPREPLEMTELPERAWIHLCCDFYGPLPSGHHLLVILDEYSRFPEVEILKSLSAKSVIPLFDKVFSSRGIPLKLKSDNGTPFQSDEFKAFMESLGIDHQKITPYWPEANGQAENFMKNIGKTVKCAQLEGKPWKQELCQFLRNYRATPHSSTGVAPATALNGYPLRVKLPEVSASSREKDSKIRHRDNVAKAKMKMYAEKRRSVRKRTLKIGDKVLMKNNKKFGKMCSKFQAEPFEVIGQKGSMIVVQRGKEVKARNISHFRGLNADEQPNTSPHKPVISPHLPVSPNTVPNTQPVASPVVSPNTSPHPHAQTTSPNTSPHAQITTSQAPVASPTSPQALRRSSRTRKQPARYDDFKINLPKSLLQNKKK
jgi:hypothetical protein